MKTYAYYLIAAGLAFLILKILFNLIFKTKKARTELSSIEKREFIRSPITEELEEAPKKAPEPEINFKRLKEDEEYVTSLIGFTEDNTGEFVTTLLTE